MICMHCTCNMCLANSSPCRCASWDALPTCTPQKWAHAGPIHAQGFACETCAQGVMLVPASPACLPVTRRSRLWLFLSYIVSFAAIVAAIWVMIAHYCECGMHVRAHVRARARHCRHSWDSMSTQLAGCTEEGGMQHAASRMWATHGGGISHHHACSTLQHGGWCIQAVTAHTCMPRCCDMPRCTLASLPFPPLPRGASLLLA